MAQGEESPRGARGEESPRVAPDLIVGVRSVARIGFHFPAARRRVADAVRFLFPAGPQYASQDAQQLPAQA